MGKPGTWQEVLVPPLNANVTATIGAGIEEAHRHAHDRGVDPAGGRGSFVAVPAPAAV
jgi:hypothetical protein